MKPGVYKATKKDGTLYYRSSITYKNKHISLGSFDTEDEASYAYELADRILHDDSYTLEAHEAGLTFQKWVSLINFRDNGIYIKTPIYLRQKYFHYYFSLDDYYIFDSDDLFYFSTHSISRRGGHLFVSDYGMQVNVLSRYGIKNYGVDGRDYRFVNGDKRDFRYENIEIVNHFHGVCQKIYKGKLVYETRIHWNGDFIVGRYETEIEAAVAYNKAASTLLKKGYEKNYPVNYLEELSGEEYKRCFKELKISKTLRTLPEFTELP
nr:hypothetical protein [Eubacterium sp.]